jgi:hypothetical protein
MLAGAVAHPFANASSRRLLKKVGERFGVQVVHIQGTAEDRRERIGRCVSEDRRR